MIGGGWNGNGHKEVILRGEGQWRRKHTVCKSSITDCSDRSNRRGEVEERKRGGERKAVKGLWSKLTKDLGSGTRSNSVLEKLMRR